MELLASILESAEDITAAEIAPKPNEINTFANSEFKHSSYNQRAEVLSGYENLPTKDTH